MSAGRISALYFSFKRAMSSFSVELRLGTPRHPVADPVLTGDAHARGLVVLRVDEHDVGDVDGTFLLHDAAGGLHRVGGREGALVALDDVQTVDVDPGLLGVHAQDLAGLAAVLAADDDDLVVAAELEAHARAPPGRGRRSS